MYVQSAWLSEQRKIGQNQKRTKRKNTKTSQSSQLPTFHKQLSLRLCMEWVLQLLSFCFLLTVCECKYKYAENSTPYPNASCCDTHKLCLLFHSGISLRWRSSFVCMCIGLSAAWHFSFYLVAFQFLCMCEYGFITVCFCIYTRLSTYGCQRVLQLQPLSLRGC